MAQAPRARGMRQRGSVVPSQAARWRARAALYSAMPVAAVHAHSFGDVLAEGVEQGPPPHEEGHGGGRAARRRVGEGEEAQATALRRELGHVRTWSGDNQVADDDGED